MSKKFIKVERPGRGPEFWDAGLYYEEVLDGGVLIICDEKCIKVDKLVKTYSPVGWESVTYEYHDPEKLEQAR